MAGPSCGLRSAIRGSRLMLKLSCRVLALLFGLGTGPGHAAETVHSLDKVEGKIRTPEGKAFYDQQMLGTPAPDSLGLHLPAPLTATAITDLLVPASDTNPKMLVGAKSWPGRPDGLVAIVCTGGEPPSDYKAPQCVRARDADTKTPLRVYLAVLESKDGAPPRVVARTTDVGGPIAWARTGLKERPMDADDAPGNEVQPDSIDQFDLAAYRLAPDLLAFGLRGGWTESYSGGGAFFTGLYLFVIDGDRLVPVLAVPMSAYKDTAGEWHKDGTRDHDITDEANVLVISPQATDGHADLIVKGRTGRFQQVYRWSKTAGAYRPAAS